MLQAQMQALAAVQAQAQIQRQMLVQSGVNITPGAPLLAGALGIPGVTPALPVVGAGGTQQATQARKSREIYIGNLCIGTVTPEMLRELFNAALAGLVPDPNQEPPVIEVKMDNTGQCCYQPMITTEIQK
jgi:splicing factor U2AF subunit